MTPDTKKIAAEMRNSIDSRFSLTEIQTETLRAWADALDPVPMGIQEAIEVLRENTDADSLDRLANVDGRLARAHAAIVAHYEAQPKAEAAEIVVWPATREYLHAGVAGARALGLEQVSADLESLAFRCVVRP